VLIGQVISSCKKEEKLPPGKLFQDTTSIQALSLYPHSVEFIKTNRHGKIFLENKSTCKTCHGEDLQGGNTKISCQSCHSVYPHSPEFKTTTLHGSQFLDNRSQCMSCHGSDFSGADTSVSCMNCHNYPHDKAWAKPSNHGAAFMEISQKQANIKDPTKRKLPECMMCHENKLNAVGTFKERHPEQFTSCSTCHADLPHGKMFLPYSADQKGPVHHKLYTKDKPELKGSCFSCHLNTNRIAPKPSESCLDCHDGLPWSWGALPEETPPSEE
jgi:hypothetical protein